MPTQFKGYAASTTGPADRGFAITPSDVSDLSATTRAIYVGTAGNLAVTLASGDAITFANVPAGAVLPVQAVAVKATGTSATDLVALS